MVVIWLCGDFISTSLWRPVCGSEFFKEPEWKTDGDLRYTVLTDSEKSKSRFLCSLGNR